MTGNSRAVRMSSRIVSTPAPIKSRAQLAWPADTKAYGNVAAAGGNASKSVVLAQSGLTGITDLNECAMLTAQIFHESNGFQDPTDNLNYKPARLLAIFPAKFESLADAQQVIGGGQVAIAKRIYDNRKSLGNVHPGDDFRYRGSSIIQLTGRVCKQYEDGKFCAGRTAMTIRVDRFVRLKHADSKAFTTLVVLSLCRVIPSNQLAVRKYP